MNSLKLREGSYKFVLPQYYGSPKEVWGFRTPPDQREARVIAEDFLKQNHELFKLEKDLDTLCYRYVLRSLGAQHVLFKQFWGKYPIHRAYVTVHMDKQGRIYMAKNRAVPMELLKSLPKPEDVRFPVDLSAAEKCALESIKGQDRSLPKLRKERRARMDEMLFPKKKKVLPAYRLRFYLKDPREEWIVFIKASGREPEWLQDWDNLARLDGRAHVFDPNPVVALDDYKSLLPARKRVKPSAGKTEKRQATERPRRPPAEAYRVVTLKDLKKSGLLDGLYVETGLRVRGAKREFYLQSHQRGFEEVMAYYHIDSAVRYLKELGFAVEEIFRVPLKVDARGSEQDNAWYSPGMGLLTFGCGGVDNAEDGEMILHEFGHALQDAICPDFGQSREAGAMGEGFGDYLAASFFADKKPPAYRTLIMSWDAVADGALPPCHRRVNEHLTFRDYKDWKDYEHTNGQIWSATLWKIREALGRRIADTLIIESHFQLDAFTTFDRGARAILDADQNLYNGAHRRRLVSIFRARRIKPVTRRH